MKQLFAFIFLFWAQHIWAQNNVNYFSDFTKLERIIPLIDNESGFNLMSNLRYCTNEEDIYFTSFNANKNSDSIILHKVSCVNYKIDSTYLWIDNLSRTLKSNMYSTIHFIAVNNKWIVVGTFNNIYIFDQKRNLINTVNNNNDYDYCKFINSDVLLIGANYNYNDKNMKNSILQLLNVESGNIIKSIIPYFELIQYTQFTPNHWIDANEKFILFSQSFNYKVDIYDSFLNYSSSISSYPKYWNRILPKLQRKIENRKMSGISAIETLLPYEDSISRLKQVFILNDSTILIYRLTNNNHFFDIWKCQNNKWIITDSNYIDSYQNGKITRLNYPIFDQKNSKTFGFTKHFLFSFAAYPPINPIGYSKKDYLKEINNYLINSYPKLVLFIYSYNFDK